MMIAADVNADLSVRKVIDTNLMDWEPGATPTVWRKTLYRVAAEPETETCIVRYDAGGHLQKHTHPQGEEVLVLDGTLSDEFGEYRVGTYILNPAGTEHAPYAKDGCTLLAILGQYHGTNRAALMVKCGSLSWLPGRVAGLSVKILYRQKGYSESMAIVKWEPDTECSSAFDGGDQEIFVLEGSFHDEHGEYGPGVWMRLPRGFRHTPGSREGGKMYVRSRRGPGEGLRVSDPGLDV